MGRSRVSQHRDRESLPFLQKAQQLERVCEHGLTSSGGPPFFAQAPKSQILCARFFLRHSGTLASRRRAAAEIQGSQDGFAAMPRNPPSLFEETKQRVMRG